jgi:hypothetical protein
VGSEVAGAQVSLLPSGWKSDGRGLATTLAGADGAYRLTVPVGEHRMVFRRDGYSERVLEVRATRDQTIDVRLSAGVRLSGRVVAGDTELPVAGAEVTVRSVRRLEDLAYATTDEQGAFWISGLMGGTYEVVARRDTLAGSYERPLLLAPSGEQRILIAIGRGAMVEGRVRHPGGAPVAGARLKLGRWDFTTSRGDPAGQADAQGRFTIRGVLPEHTSVIAFAGQHAWGSQRIHILSGDHIRDLDIVVPESRELVVSVSANGKLIDGAEVSVWSSRAGGGWDAASVTDSEGQVRFAEIPMGRTAISARHREAGAQTVVEVGTSPRTFARITLQPVELVTVEGRVSWRDGRPAGGVTVFIYCHGLGWDHQRSGPDGGYRFAGCELGPLDVRAFRSDASLDDWQRAHAPNQHRPLAAGERVRIVDLTVVDGGKRIAGRAVTADGHPAAGALVTVRGGLEKRLDSTDQEGRFEFVDLARQPHTVWVKLVGHPEAEINTSEVDAPALVVRLRAGARLSGTVRGPEGKPRPYARIMASSGNDGDETYSGGNGTYVLDGLAPGTYQVHVRGDEGFDQRVAEVVLEAGADRRLDLTVNPPTN